MFAHSKGYLYTNQDGSAFALCYRIPEWKEEYSDKLPEEESGDILYVSMAVSESKDRLSLLKMLKGYKGIKEVKFHVRGDNSKLSSYFIRGKENG